MDLSLWSLFLKLILIIFLFSFVVIVLQSQRKLNKMKHIYNDGGRKAAGFESHNVGDCVTRSIAIATGIPYIEIYKSINNLSQLERNKKSSARDGVHKSTWIKLRAWLESIGWHYHPTMGFGTGCKVHLREVELPHGVLIVQVSKHLTTVINGVIHDTFDPSRNGNRCVYGYFKKVN